MASFLEEDCETEDSLASKKKDVQARSYVHFWVALDPGDPDAGKSQR